MEVAAKFAYRNGGPIGIPRGGNMDCAMVAAAPVLPVGYVVRARDEVAGRCVSDLPNSTNSPSASTLPEPP